MASNKKISDLSPMSGSELAQNDLIMVVDKSSTITPTGENRSMEVGEFFQYIENIYPLSASKGGTGKNYLTPNTVIIGNGIDETILSNVGTDGQVLTSYTGLPPQFVDINSIINFDFTGSFVVTASSSGHSNSTASYALTASYSMNDASLVGFVLTASGTTGQSTSSYSLKALTSSYSNVSFSSSFAQTSSYSITSSLSISASYSPKTTIYNNGSLFMKDPVILEFTGSNVSASLVSVGYGRITISSQEQIVSSGRLTVLSGDPLPSSDQSGTTVYFSPYNGNRISLYDTSVNDWKTFKYSELSFSVSSSVTDKNYDVFGYLSNGSLALQTTAWSDDTTRLTPLTYLDGINVKSSDTTKRYIGTFRISGSNKLVCDTITQRFVYNGLNSSVQSPRQLYKNITGTYVSNHTWTPFNSSPDAKFEILVGLPSVVNASAMIGGGNNISELHIAIGRDSMSAPVTQSICGWYDNTVGNKMELKTSIQQFESIGYHYYSGLTYGLNSYSVGDISLPGRYTVSDVSFIEGNVVI